MSKEKSRIFQLCRAKGITQVILADKLNRDIGTINNYSHKDMMPKPLACDIRRLFPDVRQEWLDGKDSYMTDDDYIRAQYDMLRAMERERKDTMDAVSVLITSASHGITDPRAEAIYGAGCLPAEVLGCNEGAPTRILTHRQHNYSVALDDKEWEALVADIVGYVSFRCECVMARIYQDKGAYKNG